MVVQMVQLGLRKSPLPIIGRLPRNIHAGPGIKVQQVLNRDNDDTTAGAVGRPNEIPGDIVTAYSKIRSASLVKDNASLVLHARLQPGVPPSGRIVVVCTWINDRVRLQVVWQIGIFCISLKSKL